MLKGGMDGGMEGGREGGRAYLEKHRHLVALPFISLLLGLRLREEAGIFILPLRLILKQGVSEGGREGGLSEHCFHTNLPPSLPPSLPPAAPAVSLSSFLGWLETPHDERVCLSPSLPPSLLPSLPPYLQQHQPLLPLCSLSS